MNATNRLAVDPVVVVQVHVTTVEVQGISVRAVRRGRPIVPVRTNVVQRTEIVTVPRSGIKQSLI
ncbi:MAG: hypothetical protein LBS20_09190 [Prevotella sp.]|nr:hypothetical protein [Prevotella sp.]